MKKLFTILCILAVSVFMLRAQGSRLIDDSIESAILGTTKNFAVYLPAGYDESGKDYPVLYLLHGAWDNYNAWPKKGNTKFIADEVYASGLAIPAVIVMPDASGENPDFTGYRMGYFDKEGWEYEKHFFEELIPFVENKYRIASAKQTRAIAGLSMGGGGSMVYALHRPDMFSSCCPLSGLLGSRELDLGGEDFIRSVNSNDPQVLISHASDSRLDDYRSVRWYIDCGDDDFLIHFNMQTFLLMKEKNIPNQFRVRDGGHTWEYWQSALPTVLQFISIGFAGH